MARIIATGIQSFAKLRKNNCFYIDKTKFIKEWWNNVDDVTLITRPMRFGKTLMLDTVNTFFSPKFAGRSDLFAGLEIWKDEKFRNLQGTIPVIFLSFANIKNTNYEQSIETIKHSLTILYKRFKSNLDLSLLADDDIFSLVNKSMSDVIAQKSLLHLSEFIERHFKIKPIILLDEYNSLFHEAWLHSYFDELDDFMRGFFNSTFKTNPYLERGLLTGITRISNKSVSEMNNEVVSVTSDLYADCFGFTEQEVFAAMDEYELTNKDEVKQWYDGFIFGQEREIYNPWDIIGYLCEKRIAPYWDNTSSNSLVGELIAKSSVEVKDAFTRLLQGESIVTKLDEDIVFSPLFAKQGSIWSLLMSSGYVKPLEFDSISQDYKIILTNNEVKLIIEELIYDWFNNHDINIVKFIQALLSDDLNLMNENLTEIYQNKFIFFDTSGKQPEHFYHAFVLGLIVDLKGRFEITSNQSSGYGRYDVMMIPQNACDHGIVIEFKTMDIKKEASLEISCQEALQQIHAKEYSAKLLSRNISESNIYVYGFAFQGQQVLIVGGANNTLDWKNILNPKKRKTLKKKK